MGQNICCSIGNGDSREVNHWRRSEIIVNNLTCPLYCHRVYRDTGCELTTLGISRTITLRLIFCVCTHVSSSPVFYKKNHTPHPVKSRVEKKIIFQTVYSVIYYICILNQSLARTYEVISFRKFIESFSN